MLRVFISSTYQDLLDHRQAVTEAIRGLDLHADGMDAWSADDRDTATYSLDRVKQADVYVLLLAHRYGSVPEGTRWSVTELEYRAARDAKVPVLAFFLDEQVPWPPQHIEWAARDELVRFKNDVEREVTRKYFRTPQELAVQVTQALAHQIARPARRTGYRFAGETRVLSTPSRLISEPDVLVPIGTAEDDLPLVLDVSRSRDLSEPFYLLREAVSSATQPPPDEMLEAFRSSLVDYATRSWAALDMHPVELKSGEVRTLYVMPRNLMGSFHSALSGFLGRQRGTFSMPITAYRPLSPDTRSAYGALDDAPVTQLQSTGGRNRFLAIDPETGATHSVGMLGGRMVEWRPFVCESVSSVLPRTTLEFDDRYDSPSCPVGEAPEFLMRNLHDHTGVMAGRIPATTVLRTDLQSLMGVLADVADALGALHADGLVHGDVKPDNVLLTKDGVQLIDSFDVRSGHHAPGWTPDWSAPEQVRGEPVTPCSDIYPMAVMVVHALGGQIVGEVRRYRTPRGMPEVEVVHSPSLYLDRNDDTVSEQGLRPWRRLVERSLSFEPGDRPESMAEFAAELRDLLGSHPLSGTRLLSPTGHLLATQLLDGSEAVTRIV